MESETKTWGPFTGRQLTTMICVVAVTILFPVGAWAVSFTNVAITDPGGVNRAKVDANGNVAVGGTVTARPAPTAALTHDRIELGATCTAIAVPPAGKALVITSAHVNVYSDPTPGFAQNVLLYRDSNCTTLVDDVNPPGVGVTSLDYGNGLTTMSTGGLYGRVQGSVRAEVYAFGYTVAASAVPAAPTTGHRGSTYTNRNGATFDRPVAP